MSGDSMFVSDLEFERVLFPTDHREFEQDEEWCLVEMKDGERRRIRFHDYQEVFSIEGLYETLFYKKLKCKSPETIVALLDREIKESDDEMERLAVLDVGAGNGMVGEALRDAGAETVIGLDIIPEARDAALRDRPEVYDEYLVQDLTELEEPDRERIRDKGLNCLTTVAALGFGDIPPLAFANAFNLIRDEGWVAFNIKEDFLRADKDSSGFARLVKSLFEQGVMEKRQQHRYCHRLSVSGEPLYYEALVARKADEIELARLDELC